MSSCRCDGVDTPRRPLPPQRTAADCTYCLISDVRGSEASHFCRIIPGDELGRGIRIICEALRGALKEPGRSCPAWARWMLNCLFPNLPTVACKSHDLSLFQSCIKHLSVFPPQPSSGSCTPASTGVWENLTNSRGSGPA